ncbi:MAG TPA: hypothetical protein VFS20_08310 [Longimicrobium sp.]|nr:hypothetical protein [Longimicrobium sp.]
MRGFPSLPCFAALAALLFPVRSQAQPSAADTARLRQALAEVFRDDFRIVRHELSSGTPERGGTFWLVHARPLRRGNFHLTYRYRYTDQHNPRNPHYTHVQHESWIRVGERGCLRRREGKDLCLGDTIILPFVLDQHRGHTFSLAFQGVGPEYPPHPPVAERPRPAADSIPNPAAPQLRYLGSRREEYAIRSGGANYEFHAAFVARTPGRFNLTVALRTTDDSVAHSLWIGGGSVPVLVVERGQPVTVLLRDEQVTGVDSVRRFTSNGGNQYLTTLLLLQPGDSIDLPFHGYSTRPYRPVGLPPVTELREAAPAIHRSPFRLNMEERFNAWLAPHLPRERRR